MVIRISLGVPRVDFADKGSRQRMSAPPRSSVGVDIRRMVKTHASVLFILLLASSVTAQVSWTPHVDLAPRSGHAMAYDPVNKRVLMFGGGAARDDFWAWDGGGWTELRPAVKPEGRSNHTMVFDPSRRRLVLF